MSDRRRPDRRPPTSSPGTPTPSPRTRGAVRRHLAAASAAAIAIAAIAGPDAVAAGAGPRPGPHRTAVAPSPSAGGPARALAPHASGSPVDDAWRTEFERSGGTRTGRYAEAVAFCRRLAGTSPMAHVERIGTTPQGREMIVLVVDRDGLRRPQDVRRAGRAVVFIQAGIHAGEIDGKDAGLTLLRDILVGGRHRDILDGVTVLFLPVFNVDGHERFGPYNRVNQNGPEAMGWRTTAQNLNLNRDYLKADTPEMRAWLRLYTHWLPEFFVDCHVTDGADYQYTVTYALEIFGNMDAGLTRWTRERYLEPLRERMRQDGFPIVRYNAYRRRHDPRSGLVSWAAGPRFSEGYTAVQNRPGLLIETHMLKPYAERVRGTRAMLLHTLELVARDAARLRRLCQRADAYTASADFRREPFPLSFRAGPDSVTIDFLGVDYETVTSDLTGGRWVRFHPDRPRTFRIPYFHTQIPATTVRLPEAYLVPPEWVDVIDRLRLHGVRIERLERDATLDVHVYRFTSARWSEPPYEGRHRVRVAVRDSVERVTFPAGTAVVDMAQRAARVAAHALEPLGPDSFVRWGFFDAVFEQKEYVEPYVIEQLARRMLRDDPALAAAFQARRAADSTFAADPEAIRRWFYERSPYWDRNVRRYPVGRLFERERLERLPRRPDARGDDS